MSSLIDCPACSRSVPADLLNLHLDADCCSSSLKRRKLSHQPSFSKVKSPTSPTLSCPEPPRSTSAVKYWQQEAGKAAKSRTLGFGKPAGGQNQRKPVVPLTDAELQACSPLSLVRDVLPGALADELLAALLAESGAFTRGTWHLFNKVHEAPRSSLYFHLERNQVIAGETDTDGMLDVSKSVAQVQPPASLLQAADIVNAAVTRLSRDVVQCMPEEDRPESGGWQASYALANHYADGSECVGAHSDRLTQLGPRCTIASLSLGATRLFRMRKTVAGEGEADDPGAGPKNNAGGSPQATPTRSANGAATQVGFASIDVLLPHNTLVVMFPPAQEEWKHEVPRCKAVPHRHTLSGDARINLTFRKLKPEWGARAPKCRCGRPSVLRAAKRQNAYYFTCDASNPGSQCKFWQWLEL